MSTSATKTSIITTPSGPITTDSATVTYDAGVELNLDIPANVTSKVYQVSLPFTGLRMFAIGLAQEEGDTGVIGPVTVVMSSGDTYTVTVENGLNWVDGDLTSKPLSGTVASISITNPNTANMVLHVRSGYVSPVVV